MPRISAFYGVTIWMSSDEGAHARPRFHARYGEYQASVDFHGDVVVGWLPPRALGLVSEWALLHAEELQANWDRTRPSTSSPDRAAGLAWNPWIPWSMSLPSR